MEVYMGYQASLADSGPQTSSITSNVCRKLGLEPEDYLPTEMSISGASGDPLAVRGAILARVQVGRAITHQMMYVIDNPVGPVLSKGALIDLGIIPKDFPYQQQAPVDLVGEDAAAKVTTEWNEMAARVTLEWKEMGAKMLPMIAHPSVRSEIPRGHDMARRGGFPEAA